MTALTPPPDELTAEELAAIRERHYPEAENNGTPLDGTLYCRHDSDPWPCDASRLLDHAQSLAGRLADTQDAVRALVGEVQVTTERALSAEARWCEADQSLIEAESARAEWERRLAAVTAEQAERRQRDEETAVATLNVAVGTASELHNLRRQLTEAEQWRRDWLDRVSLEAQRADRAESARADLERRVEQLGKWLASVEVAQCACCYRTAPCYFDGEASVCCNVDACLAARRATGGGDGR